MYNLTVLERQYEGVGISYRGPPGRWDKGAAGAALVKSCELSDRFRFCYKIVRKHWKKEGLVLNGSTWKRSPCRPLGLEVPGRGSVYVHTGTESCSDNTAA